MPIFYFPDLAVENSSPCIHGGDEKHIKTVLRKRVGDSITLTNGKGLKGYARITNITNKEIHLSVESWKQKKKSFPRISLAFSLLKKNSDLIIEKCTELGITNFYPFVSARSVKINFSQKLETRFSHIATAAMKQCNSVYLPQTHPVNDFTQLISSIHQTHQLILAWEEETENTLHKALENSKQNICLIVGPEGGFSSHEVNTAQQAGAQIITLGNHILRAETAAITITAQTIYECLKKDSDFY